MMLKKKLVAARRRTAVPYGDFVADNFDDIALAELQLADGTPAEEDKVKRDKQDEENLRTITVNLKNILRQNIGADVVEHFLEKTSSTAVQLTDDISEIAALTRAMMLKYVTSPPGGNEFSVTDLLPKNAVRNRSLLDDEGCIHVQPLNAKHDDEKMKTDREALFKQAHTQYLQARYLQKQENGSRPPAKREAQIDEEVQGPPQKKAIKKNKEAVLASTDSKHPLWSSLAPNEKLPQSTDGMSQILSSAVQQFAQNLETMWKGGIMPKLAEKVVRVLLKLLLTPKKESYFWNRTHPRSEEAKMMSKEKTEDRNSRGAQRYRLYLEIKNRKKIKKRMESYDPEEVQKQKEKLRASDDRLKKLKDDWQKRLQTSRTRQVQKQNNVSAELTIEQ